MRFALKKYVGSISKLFDFPKRIIRHIYNFSRKIFNISLRHSMLLATIAILIFWVSFIYYFHALGVKLIDPNIWISSQNEARIDRSEQIRNLFWTLALIAGSFFGIWTWINSVRRTNYISVERESEKSQIDYNLFDQALQNLAEDSEIKRMGAIHTLETIMMRSVDNYELHRQCSNMLVSFVNLSRSEINSKFDAHSNEIEEVFWVLHRQKGDRYEYASTIQNCSFESDVFSHMHVDGIQIKNSRVKDCEISGMSICKTSIFNCEFINSIIGVISIDGSDVEQVSFEGANFERIVCIKSDLVNCDIAIEEYGSAVLAYSDIISSRIMLPSTGRCIIKACDISDSELFFDDCGDGVMNILNRCVWDPDRPPRIKGIESLPHRGDFKSPLSTDAIDITQWKKVGLDGEALSKNDRAKIFPHNFN